MSNGFLSQEEIDSLYKLIAQCKDALLSLQSKKEQENNTDYMYISFKDFFIP